MNNKREFTYNTLNLDKRKPLSDDLRDSIVENLLGFLYLITDELKDKDMIDYKINVEVIGRDYGE